MASNSVASGGVSFFGLLFITFLVLKLTEVIDWSWLWITAPLWGGVAVIITILIVFLLFFVISFVIHNLRKK